MQINSVTIPQIEAEIVRRAEADPAFKARVLAIISPKRGNDTKAA